jgi:hypothetical protein
LLSLSFFFTEVAVLSVSHAVIVGFGGCSINWNQHVVKQNVGLVSGCWHSLGKQEYYKPLC